MNEYFFIKSGLLFLEEERNINSINIFIDVLLNIYERQGHSKLFVLSFRCIDRCKILKET